MVWFNAEDDDDVWIAVAVRCSAVADDDDGKPAAFAAACRAAAAAAAAATAAGAEPELTQFWSDELLPRERGPADPKLHNTNDILRANFHKPVKRIRYLKFVPFCVLNNESLLAR